MINILLSIPWGYLFLFLFLAVFISFLSYKNERFNSKLFWWILFSVRTVVIFLLLFLLAQPVIIFSEYQTQKPSIALLIDNSQSMDIALSGSGQTKNEFSQNIYTAIEKLKEINNCTILSFSNNVSAVNIDSLSFNGSRTNITEALNYLNRQDNLSPQQLILISDGNHNAEQQPFHFAENSPFPIHTIGVGSVKQKPDVVLQSLNANSVGYSNVGIPVEFTIQSTGFEGKKIVVTIFENENILETNTFQLPNNSFEVIRNSYQYFPKSDGIKKLTVKINPLAGESTVKNNILSRFINVKKTKLRVLLLSGSPSPDVGAISRAVSFDPNIELDQFLQKPNGEIYSLSNKSFRTTLEESECLILVGFPTSSTLRENINLIQGEIQNKNKSLLFIYSRNVNLTLLDEMKSSLPFNVSSVKVEEVMLLPQIVSDHFLLTGLTSQNINYLPPLFTFPGLFQTKEEATTLLQTSSSATSGKLPLLIIKNIANKKSVAFTSFGLWRWGLLNNDKLQENFFNHFVVSIIRWLGSDEKEKKFRVNTDALFFTQNEEINFRAEAYTETYQPINDLQIDLSVKLLNSNQALNYTFGNGKNGLYTTTLSSFQPGDYYFSAKVNKLNLSDEGRFSVGDESPEFINTTLNRSLLQQISSLSGGLYFDYNNLNVLLDTLIQKSKNNETHKTTHTSEFEFKSLASFLIFIILLLSTEWFLRKRYSIL